AAPAVVCFFFFQAEDGIRDRNVTGVQTCALPISSKFFNTMTPDPLILSAPWISVFDVTTHASPPPAARASVANPQSTAMTATATVTLASLMDSPRVPRRVVNVSRVPQLECRGLRGV